MREISQGILGPIVGLAMTKELGPVLMGFLLAGRAGSAMAAELGAMTVYDEINALRTMDIDPVRFLVLPRFVAATIALPILVLYADFIGIAGGALVVAIDPAIKLSANEYLQRMLEWVHLKRPADRLREGAVFGMVRVDRAVHLRAPDRGRDRGHRHVDDRRGRVELHPDPPLRPRDRAR